MPFMAAITKSGDCEGETPESLHHLYVVLCGAF